MEGPRARFEKEFIFAAIAELTSERGRSGYLIYGSRWIADGLGRNGGRFRSGRTEGAAGSRGQPGSIGNTPAGRSGSAFREYLRKCAMKFDVVLIGDFRVPGGTSRQASNAIAALHRAGLSVGLVGVQLPHARGPKPLDPLVRERVFLGEAKVISPARHPTIEAGLVMFENPRAFLEPPEAFFRIEATTALMTVHFPLRDGKSRPTFDPERVLEVCRGITDAEVVWAPVSPLVRRLLRRGSLFSAADRAGSSEHRFGMRMPPGEPSSAPFPLLAGIRDRRRTSGPPHGRTSSKSIPIRLKFPSECSASASM